MPVLSSNNQKILLELARETIGKYLVSGDSPVFSNSDPEFHQKLGCFVTLHLKNKLRGCVGTFETKEPLYQNVMRMAMAAAFRDTRFSPVTKNEMKDMVIDISVLGPLELVRDIQDIEIGKHGIYVRLGYKSGTFLPEVATEQKWNVVEFVTYCAREKAGMSPEECARAEIYRYEVEKFSEKK